MPLVEYVSGEGACRGNVVRDDGVSPDSAKVAINQNEWEPIKHQPDEACVVELPMHREHDQAIGCAIADK